MSTRPTTMPESGGSARGRQRRWLPRLRDAKIRSKLGLILIVPVAAVVALGAARLVESGSRAAEATVVRSLTGLAGDVSALAHDAHRERMAAAQLLSAASGQSPDAYNTQVRRTDERIARYQAARRDLGSVPAAVEARLARIDEHLATLNATRQEVLGNRQVSVSEVVLRYGVILGDLAGYGEVLGQIAGEGQLAEGLRAAAAFARAKAATAEEQAVAFAGLLGGGRLDAEQFSSFTATLTSQQEALLAFSVAASVGQRALVNTTVTGDAVILADQVSTEIARSVGAQPRITAEDADRAIGAVNDLMRWAEVRLYQELLADADAVRGDVLRQVLIESVLLIVALVVAVALAVVLARSLVRSLSRLREGALAVAGHDLPEAVARLRDARNLDDGAVEEIANQVRDPIRLPHRDEVGQVAQAFNVVHREAVRIAAEQAALRTSVSTMFLNLARRSQSLVDRMIGELDQIERTEEDPKRLAQLFQLDHLATRMRRNDENLLVLAGADSTAPRREDGLLIDVLRAAQSEVELYNRIEFGTIDYDISVAAPAVNDVVRLLAELLDNATRFSPPNTVVVAEARRIRDYVLVQVEDRGLGISEEQLESLNRRLAEPPAVDVGAFRLMGLAVVGRLAARYGISVELRNNVEGGTVAHVNLPNDILVLPRLRGRDQMPGRPRGAGAPPDPAPAAGDRGGWADPAPALPTRFGAAALPGGWAGQSGRPAAGAEPAEPARRPAPPVTPTYAAPAPPRPRPTTSQQPPARPAPAAPDYPPARPAPAAVPEYPPTRSGPVTPEYTAAGAPPMSLGREVPALHDQASSRATTPAGPTRAGDGVDSPIFREMEASWFRTHDDAPVEPWAMPTAGHPPPPAPPAVVVAAPAPTGYAFGGAAPLAEETAAARPGGFAAAAAPGLAAVAFPMAGARPAGAESASGGAAATESAGGGPRPADAGGVPRPRASAESRWQTRADEGWRRATQAAEPEPAGITRSGLPKRVPQAQLVPGGIEPNDRDRRRRTPDEVRGLLAAYHRGVQRGRSAGDAAGPGGEPSSLKETSR